MGAKSLYGPLNSFHMLSLCEYPGIEVSLSARQTEGEGVEDVHVGRHTRILNSRPRCLGLPGFMARLSSLFGRLRSGLHPSRRLEHNNRWCVLHRVSLAISSTLLVLPQHVVLRSLRTQISCQVDAGKASV